MSATEPQPFEEFTQVVHAENGRRGAVVRTETSNIIRVLWSGDAESSIVPRAKLRLADATTDTVAAESAPAEPAPESAPVQKSHLDWALDAQRRGWFVFPCHPKTKSPATEHGFKDASNSPDVIREWWAKNPNYNPAISLGPSNLVVYDFDAAKPFADMPPTFTVKTGRAEKDGISGIQMYYAGSCKTRNMYIDANGNPSADDNDKKIGEIRSRGAYVMYAGSVHPISGNLYQIISDVALTESPEQNVPAPIVAGPARGTDEQEEAAELVEAAFDESGIEYQMRKEHNGGFKWNIVCPWFEQHSVGKKLDSSSSVIMWPDGKLIYECKHRCLNIRQWKELREWMTEKVGHPLVFAKPTITVLIEGKPAGQPNVPVAPQSPQHF